MFEDAKSVLNMSRQFSGNNPGVKGVDIDSTALESVGQLPCEQDIGQFGLTVGRIGAILSLLPADVIPLNSAIFVSKRTDRDYPGSRSSLLL